MFPHQERWKPRYGKPRHENKQKISSFRPLNGNSRSASANNGRYFQIRQRPYVPAGMFANAISSVPQIPSAHQQGNPSFNPNARETIFPERSSSIPIRLPKVNISKPWDFSDVCSQKDHSKSITKATIPRLKQINSDEEYPKNNEVQDTSIATNDKPVMPWLKKWDSDDEAASKTPRKTDKLEIPKGFDETIARFSARLDRPDAVPTLSLQNHTETTMGTVEKTLMAVVVAQSKSEGHQQSLPLFDMLVERSDWLMFREEFNDETDYPPRDPFFSHDVVSSAFEEYERDQEAACNPSYAKMLKSSEITEDSDDRKDNSDDTLDFLTKSNEQDSQDDFFNQGSPLTSSPTSSFSLFDYSAPSTSKETFTTRKSTKRRLPTDSVYSGATSSSKKKRDPDDPLENVPRLVTSSEYSPFDYSLFSGTSPPSKSSPRPPKYSFW